MVSKDILEYVSGQLISSLSEANNDNINDNNNSAVKATNNNSNINMNVISSTEHGQGLLLVSNIPIRLPSKRQLANRKYLLKKNKNKKLKLNNSFNPMSIVEPVPISIPIFPVVPMNNDNINMAKNMNVNESNRMPSSSHRLNRGEKNENNDIMDNNNYNIHEV